MGSQGSVKKKILQELHSSALGVHSGAHHTYKRVKQYFYWLGLKQDVKNYTKNCTICIQNKVDNQPYAGLLQPLPVPTRSW